MIIPGGLTPEAVEAATLDDLVAAYRDAGFSDETAAAYAGILKSGANLAGANFAPEEARLIAAKRLGITPEELDARNAELRAQSDEYMKALLASADAESA